MKTGNPNVRLSIYLLTGLLSVGSLPSVAHGSGFDSVEKAVKNSQKQLQEPAISADPERVQFTEGESESFTKLTWSGGTQHPGAKLAVKAQGSGERIVDPQSNGSREVKVKAGQTYLYSVVDGGHRLASVTVGSDQSSRGHQKKKRHHDND